MIRINSACPDILEAKSIERQLPRRQHQHRLGPGGLLVVLGLGLLTLGSAASAPASSPAPRWPSPDSPLTAPQVPIDTSCQQRLFIDPGHGAPGNRGCTSAYGVPEEVFTLPVAEHLAEHLENVGHRTRLSRRSGQRVPYRARLRAAHRWGADAFVSLHADVRGTGMVWASALSGDGAYNNDSQPGFAVLWSDEGPSPLATARQRLARAVARRMTEAGFLPYDGWDYAGLYATDTEVAGVFVDRHVPSERIYFLRAPRMPSIIIETHHAWDRRAALRWTRSDTWHAFSSAVAAAICDTVTPEG